MLSQLQQLNEHKGVERNQLMKQAEEHLKCVVRLYKIQWQEGRQFLHEHPAGATSWQFRVIQDLLKLKGVQTTIADQCMYGLNTWSTNRATQDTPARKNTKSMTNSECLAKELANKCDKSHVHQVLLDGRAKGAAAYPRG